MIVNCCRCVSVLILLASGCTYNPVQFDPVSGFRAGGGIGVLCGGPLDPWMQHCCPQCGCAGPCPCGPATRPGTQCCPAPGCPPAPICAPAPVCAPVCPPMGVPLNSGFSPYVPGRGDTLYSVAHDSLGFGGLFGSRHDAASYCRSITQLANVCSANVRIGSESPVCSSTTSGSTLSGHATGTLLPNLRTFGVGSGAERDQLSAIVYGSSGECGYGSNSAICRSIPNACTALRAGTSAHGEPTPAALQYAGNAKHPHAAHADATHTDATHTGSSPNTTHSHATHADGIRHSPTTSHADAPRHRGHANFIALVASPWSQKFGLGARFPSRSMGAGSELTLDMKKPPSLLLPRKRDVMRKL